MEIIKINGITKDYKNGKGVFDLTFSVQKGEIMGFLGPNGAGKTTTIRQLMGFIRPDRGTVSINGIDCFVQADKIADNLGYLPGETAFMDEMSTLEFIKFIAGMKNITDLSLANSLIKRFDLDTKGKIKKLSKGTKQKIAIVCAFMKQCDVYILDEPTSGLDPLMQSEFLNLLLEEKHRGATILMSSHIFEEIEKVCDRTAIIKNGKLLTIQNAHELKENRSKKVEITFENSQQAAQFARENKNAALKENVVSLILKGSADSLIKQLAKYEISDISTHTQSLEELFIHYYGGGENA